MEVPYPPDKSKHWYEKVIGSLPEHLRDDAIQDAWVAYLEGHTGKSGIRRLQRRAARLAVRECELPTSDIGSEFSSSSPQRSRRLRAMVREDDAR